MGFNFFKKKNKEINKPAEPVIPEKPEILTKEEILSRILDGDFSNLIELRAETRGEIIYIPELEMSIKPLVLDVKELFALVLICTAKFGKRISLKVLRVWEKTVKLLI